MELDFQCCKTAQYVVSLGKYQHSRPDQRNNHGENIAFSYGTTKEAAVQSAIKMFYDEINFYNYQDPRRVPPGEQVGHFTQVIYRLFYSFELKFSWSGPKRENWALQSAKLITMEMMGGSQFFTMNQQEISSLWAMKTDFFTRMSGN